MAITLQSTVGGFSAEFMRKLPKLEQIMIAHGLEPSEFVISKDRATPPTVPQGSKSGGSRPLARRLRLASRGMTEFSTKKPALPPAFSTHYFTPLINARLRARPLPAGRWCP